MKRSQLLAGVTSRGRADALEKNVAAGIPMAQFRPGASASLDVIVVDPFRKSVTKATLIITAKHSDKQMRKLCRANKLGTHEIGASVDDDLVATPLMAAGAFGISSAVKGWYLEHNEMKSPVTGGIGVIFAKGPIDGGMVPLPPEITLDWVKERVMWHDGIAETAPGGSGELAQEYVDREPGFTTPEQGGEALPAVPERDGEP